MKNIHLIPTDKPNMFSLNSSGKYHLTNQLHTNSPNFTNQNIYITSDEEIKEGDYKLDTFHNQVSNVISINSISKYDKKIILTIDSDLIKDSVQKIDDDFLDWFCKNPSCEEVMTIKNYLSNDGQWKDVLLPSEWEIDTKIKYKIIYTLSEPLQEMTLVNIETYDTKVYTFKNKEGELYHVIKQDSFLNNIYPEYRFMGHNQSEMMDEKTINEMKKVMEKWEK
jgi:hypothetical protein